MVHQYTIPLVLKYTSPLVLLYTIPLVLKYTNPLVFLYTIPLVLKYTNPLVLLYTGLSFLLCCSTLPSTPCSSLVLFYSNPSLFAGPPVFHHQFSSALVH